MTQTRPARFPIVLFVLFVLLPPIAGPASAQAWLPEKGEATVSMAFQNIFVKDHFLTTERFDLGAIESNTLMIDASYSVTRRLAIDFGLPYISSKYNGPYPHLPSVVGDSRPSIDTGHYHGTFQDLRFGVRYNLVSGGFAITPFVGTVAPTHDYSFYAHSAVGRRLHELSVGTYVAKVLDDVVPGAFVQARYAYSFAQKVLDISHNHSNLDLEAGYFITPELRVFALGSGQLTHGGVDLTFDSIVGPDGNVLSRLSETGEVLFGPQYEHNHDRLDRSNFLNIGAGAAVSLSDSVDLFGSFVKSVAVRNGHAVNRGITIGVSWTVRPKARVPERQAVTARAGRSLARCTCQKGRS